MIFLYFSGTGNTKFCVEYFAGKIGESKNIYSIEQPEALETVQAEEEIIFGYPVYYSNLPKIVSDFINSHAELWKNKKIIIICTMGAFSGDGAGVAGRLFKRYGASVIGGLHLKMPDCILDVKALKKSNEDNLRIVEKTKQKLDKAAAAYKNNKMPKEGIGILYHIAGLFGQRLYFYNKTRKYSDKLKIDESKCILCGKCISLCPMHNIMSEKSKIMAYGKCTMCYRCINNCPKQAITLIGRKVVAEPFDKYEF